ncbi:MAG: TatD family hydrolase [Bacteriovoracaceae bacterium]
MFIDSHCHLFYEDFKDDLAEVIRRAQDAGVDRFIVPATNHITAQQAIELAEQFPSVYVAAGFHPLDLTHYSEANLSRVESYVSHPKVIAVGEIGIDYFYDTSPREYQREIFSVQIELAIRKDLPIIVHTRDSVQDAVDIVIRYATNNPQWKRDGLRGVFHCFTGDAAQARTLFDHGFLVSFPGPITFKKATMPNVAKEIGLANIMIETDAPFLTPVPYRGKRNEPAYIPIIGRTIAEILNIAIEEVASVTTKNAIRLFGLPDLEKNNIV